MKRLGKIFKLIAEIFRPFFKVMGVIFFLLLLGEVIYLIRPYLQGKLIDALGNHSSPEKLFEISLLLLATYMAVNIVGYAREYIDWKYFHYNVDKHIIFDGLKRLFSYSIGQHLNEHSGLRQNVFTRGQSSMENLIGNITNGVIPVILQIVLASVAIMINSFLLGLIVFLSSALYLYLTLSYNFKLYPKARMDRDNWKKLSKKHSEILRHLPLIKAESQELATLDEHSKERNNAIDYAKELWLPYSRVTHGNQALIDTFQIITLFIAAILVTKGIHTPGLVVATIGWIGSIFGNVSSIGWMQRQMITQIADIEAYVDLISIPPAIVERPDAKEIKDVEGRIEFRNVSFAYPIYPEKDAADEDIESENKETEISKETLVDVSFIINTGETAAIVGHSGAGKTTIVQMLLRGYDPDEGGIYIDNYNLKDIKLSSYLSKVGYVEQNVRLFDGPLRDNIVFGVSDKENITEEMLENISEKSRIDQFYERLGTPRFNALIGENGIWLSGGERQRVGIARALIKNPQILIFDEATSSLDAENEKLIHEAMREALKGRTGIIIAHRLSTIKDADKIIVMENGRVVGIGKHDELLLTCDPYKRLVEHQMVI